MINLSPREKTLAFAVCAVLIFFAYWNLTLDPVIKSIASVKAATAQLRLQIGSFNALNKAGLPTLDKKIDIYPKEEQLALIVGFFESQMKEDKIKMLSLKQVSADNKISIDIEMEGSYSGFVKLFESMSKLNTLFDLDFVSMTNQSKTILTKARIVTPFL